MNNMNHSDGWMSGWSGGGMWIWPVIGVAVVVLLVVVIINQSKKKIMQRSALRLSELLTKKKTYADQITN